VWNLRRVHRSRPDSHARRGCPEDTHDAASDDAAVEAPSNTDGSDSCIALTNEAPPIDEVNSTDPVPLALDGSIVDGTYFASHIVNYGDADAGYNAKAFQETILISNGMIHLVRDWPGIVLPHVEASATFTVANNQIQLRYVCAPSVPGSETSETRRYTSAARDGRGVELTIFDAQHDKELVVFTRQWSLPP
jgi:hypothetical protein